MSAVQPSPRRRLLTISALAVLAWLALIIVLAVLAGLVYGISNLLGVLS